MIKERRFGKINQIFWLTGMNCILGGLLCFVMEWDFWGFLLCSLGLFSIIKGTWKVVWGD